MTKEKNNELEQFRQELEYWDDKMRHGKTKKERENATKVYNELARAYLINLMAKKKKTKKLGKGTGRKI